MLPSAGVRRAPAGQGVDPRTGAPAEPDAIDLAATHEGRRSQGLPSKTNYSESQEDYHHLSRRDDDYDYYPSMYYPEVKCKHSNTGIFSFLAFCILSFDITADIMKTINISIDIGTGEKMLCQGSGMCTDALPGSWGHCILHQGYIASLSTYICAPTCV